MNPERTTPAFAISSDSAFTEEGVWLIELQLRITPTSEATSVVLDKARPALTYNIVREALRGRSLGATKIRVHLDTGTHMTDFVLPEAVLRSGALE